MRRSLRSGGNLRAGFWSCLTGLKWDWLAEFLGPDRRGNGNIGGPQLLFLGRGDRMTMPFAALHESAIDVAHRVRNSLDAKSLELKNLR